MNWHLTVSQESTVHMVLRMRGYGYPIWIVHEGQRTSLLPDNNQTIGSIKLKIFSQFGIHPRKQVLTCQGKLVLNSKHQSVP